MISLTLSDEETDCLIRCLCSILSGHRLMDRMIGATADDRFKAEQLEALKAKLEELRALEEDQ